ncbi:MAG: hypothetical protein A3J45_09060 [Candidatus Rokubacteria bacterium RIFCSPHIGHO2_02_FULL_69_13]|nr:MAG: hypothetical protein A3J45_09060 [Candidatus Rokubacteria bacterium RIFCSPHIGHO2_02_FULL_69_13]
MRVLVVEDEPDLGDLFGDFLRELGHQPLVVRSAEAALGRLTTERADAIILDIHLPGMSGLDFLQLRPVRELGIPIVAVSGVVSESQARECLRLGAADFLGKPVDLARLGEVLAVLEPHALSRLLERPDVDDRRRTRRARVSLPVLIREYRGVEHQATAVEVGRAGMKIQLSEDLAPRSAVKISFTLLDDGPALEAVALILRHDPDGYALTFVNLPERNAERLDELVRRRG